MDVKDERYFLAALLQVAGIGRQKAAALINIFGSARAVWEANSGDLFLARVLSTPVVEALLKAKRAHYPEKLEQCCCQSGIRIVAKGDQTYPALLAETPDAPLVLYYQGQLPSFQQAVAIVGTRKATQYGIAVAKEMAAYFAKQGVVVVSGGALGIDCAAHEGALTAGITASVLGCGVDVAYPLRHKRLFAQIAASGGVLISEYPPGNRPTPGQFPARNRIISGLSSGVVVVEAGKKSGALITADLALDYNRDVFCVPGSVFSPVSQGAHFLIKQGAQLVERPEEVLDALGFAGMATGQEKDSIIPLNVAEKTILACCSDLHPTMGEVILDQTGFAPAKAAQILLSLEMKKLVKRSEDGYWRLRGR